MQLCCRLVAPCLELVRVQPESCLRLLSHLGRQERQALASSREVLEGALTMRPCVLKWNFRPELVARILPSF